jgi:hypothetical protein
MLAAAVAVETERELPEEMLLEQVVLEAVARDQQLQQQPLERLTQAAVAVALVVATHQIQMAQQAVQVS